MSDLQTIGLVQVDGKFPNLALMQIGAYHKLRGDTVGWWDGPLFEYDWVYASKIFNFSDMPQLPKKSSVGGTGINFWNRLPGEIADIDPSGGWFLYPKWDSHLGFTERGCRFKCAFCCVPQKEGKPQHNSSIEDLLTNPKGGPRLTLLDDDFFGNPEWEARCDEIIKLKLRVNFSQGLNIRVITPAQAGYLSRISFWNTSFKYKQVTFAWDRYRDKKAIRKGFDICINAGIRPWQMQFFVLIGFDTTPDEDRERVETLRDWGADPFVMAYDRTDDYQRAFQRWVNHRAIFNSISFEDYRPGVKAVRGGEDIL